jgi:hypothetical protein
MSKLVSVAATVGSQLHHEGHWPPNDITKVMGADYHYSTPTMLNFLTAVQWHLANGSPPYTFQFDLPFATNALGDTVAQLITDIDGQTT